MNTFSFAIFGCFQDSPTPVKGLNAMLQASNLRMADEKLLFEKLKVLPGCVTPFAILNDET